MDSIPHHAPAVVFCSINRPQMLHESVLCVVRQTVPCRIYVSVPDESDVSKDTCRLPAVTVVYSPKGSTKQRNRAMDSIEGDPEMILFLDDDMELEDGCIEKLLDTLRSHPEACMVNGFNIAQGIYAPGTLTREIARSLIQDRQQAGLPEVPLFPVYAGYGCLMAIRGALRGKVRWDERLVLYAFLEDMDFSLQCRKYGAILENRNALAVHIEVAHGRMGEKLRGYSEVVNPFYILSKKTGAVPHRVFLGSVRRTMRSLGMVFKGQGAERFIGNLLGWANVATLRPDPEKILTMR